ncbi:MAG: tetratricopeptide repeat protein [Deltaproteobacteria bacterium]|nr:tetratricopeptide repeat protein [Deltaproteobacteria bacterium]
MDRRKPRTVTKEQWKKARRVRRVLLSGDWRKAMELADDFMDSFPAEPGSLLEARKSFGQGDFARALGIAKIWLDGNPSDPAHSMAKMAKAVGINFVGDCHYCLGDYSKAERAYVEANRMDPSSMACLGLARIALLRKDKDLARKALKILEDNENPVDPVILESAEIDLDALRKLARAPSSRRGR